MCLISKLNTSRMGNLWLQIWANIRGASGVSRAVLNEGYRWRIGDGRSVEAWNHPWLRDEQFPHVLIAPTQDIAHLTVQDLWLPGTKRQNLELLHLIFHPNDVDQILQAPLVECPHPDRCVWQYNEDEKYSVKSMYSLYSVTSQLIDTISKF